MKFYLCLIIVFSIGTAEARNTKKGSMPPLPLLEGVKQNLDYDVECKQPCDKTTIEGKIQYRSALYQNLYIIKDKYEKALKAEDTKALKDLEKTYFQASIGYLKYNSYVEDELSSQDIDELMNVKKALTKCENDKQPIAVNNSTRSFFDSMKDMFSMERKNGPAPVEDRSVGISK